MSLRQNILITIEQQANQAVPGRKLNTYSLDFVNWGEIVSSWQNLTDTAKLKIPRNIYIEDQNGNPFPLLLGTNVYGSSGNSQPVLLRGDKISITVGLFIDDFKGGETLEMPAEPQFQGYITKIKNRAPLEIECEDEMFKMKKINTPNKLFRGSEYTVKQMLCEMLNGSKINDKTPYVVSDGGASVNIGDFRTQNETVAMVLERLRSTGGLYSYFRNLSDGKKELRCSGIVYYPKEIQVQEVFEFQENIISDTLEYTRKEDLSIAVKAIAQNITNGTNVNEDGTLKSKKTRVEVVVGLNDKGEIAELNAKDKFAGDLITFPVLSSNNITKAELLKRAKEYLPKFYYTGFRGSFTTFIIPQVKHGNAAILRNKVIPEMSGTYLIKQVTTKFGMQGNRQEVMTHIRIDQGYTQDQLNAGI
jgi:hypothetical protein